MDGLNTVFLLVCFSSAAFAYECVLKACLYEEESQDPCFAETTCTTDDANGCLIQRYTGNFRGTFHNCSSIPTLYMYNGTDVTVDCCFTDECNDDTMESNTVTDPSVDECYSVICTTENTESCLSNAIMEGNARICPRPPDGDCATSIGDFYMTSCTWPGICVESQNEVVKVDCCTGDLCNSPTGYTEPTTEAITTSTAMMVKSSFGTSEPDAYTSTKKDTSGAGHQGHTLCFICSLAILLLSIVS